MVEGGGFEPPKAYADRFTVCSLWPLGNPSDNSVLIKSESTGCSKNLLARRKKKFKAEAYLVIREGLNILQQRSQQRFFNSLITSWSWRWDLNPQPADYKSAALPLSYASRKEEGYYLCLPKNASGRSVDFKQTIFNGR
jgi:hypothetical protein